MPQSEADDEVAELARTLEGMLRELDAARAETEAMLARQRRFVADASHELRTPLTSVLANLELLAESLRGDRARPRARRCARRSGCAGWSPTCCCSRAPTSAAWSPHEPCDLAQIVVEAAGELGPVSGEHEISLDARPAPSSRARATNSTASTINLIENALRHTPPGTEIRVRDRRLEGDGPCWSSRTTVPASRAAAPTLFERFVRGAGDRGGALSASVSRSFSAVAESHGGNVTLESVTPHGARFVVRLPTAARRTLPGRNPQDRGRVEDGHIGAVT